MQRLFILIFLIASSCQTADQKDIVSLFDLKAYLADLEKNWKGKTIEKIYQSGQSKEERTDILPSDVSKSIGVLYQYDINKPDYEDKYTVQVNTSPLTSTYRSNAKGPKVKLFRIFGDKTNPDSIQIEYWHKSFIGDSQHTIRVNANQIILSRVEKYVLSDSLKSTLILRIKR